jgi:hypothetical protein
MRGLHAPCIDGRQSASFMGVLPIAECQSLVVLGILVLCGTGDGNDQLILLGQKRGLQCGSITLYMISLARMSMVGVCTGPVERNFVSKATPSPFPHAKKPFLPSEPDRTRLCRSLKLPLPLLLQDTATSEAVCVKKGGVWGTVTIGSKDFYLDLRPIISGYFPSRMT